MPYKIYRGLCSTPPELADARDSFQAVNVRFTEEVLMPDGLLFAFATFRDGFDANLHRASGEANVRMVELFVHIFGETAPQPAYRGFVELAAACLVDSSRPIEAATVFFPRSSSLAPELAELRDGLRAANSCEVREYGDRADLERQFREMLEGWHAGVRQKMDLAQPPALK